MLTPPKYIWKLVNWISRRLEKVIFPGQIWCTDNDIAKNLFLRGQIWCTDDIAKR